MSPQFFREKLILSKRDNREVFIPEDFAPYLTPFQRDAIRFLCRQFYKAQPGAAVSSASGRGRTAAATLLLEALRPALRPLASLVLCRPERLDHWHRHLRRWTTSALETLEQSSNIHVKKELFLCPLSSMALLSLARRDWGIIMVDDPGEGFNMQQLLPLKAKYKIWLTNSNLAENLPSLELVCQWFNPKEKIDVKSFEKKGLNVMEQAEKDIALDIFCQEVLFNNTSDCSCLLDEVPFASISTVVVDQSSSVKDDSITGLNEITRKNMCATVLVDQSSSIKVDNITGVDEITRKNKDATGLKIKRSRMPEHKIIKNDIGLPHNREVTDIFDDFSSKIPKLCKNIEANQRDDKNTRGSHSVNNDSIHTFESDNNRINVMDVMKAPLEKDKPTEIIIHNTETDKVSQKNINSSQGNALIESLSCTELQNVHVADCNEKNHCPTSPVAMDINTIDELSQRRIEHKASVKKVEDLVNKQFKGSFLDSLF